MRFLERNFGILDVDLDKNVFHAKILNMSGDIMMERKYDINYITQ